MMTQYMMGMVQSGTGVLFDDTDRLTRGKALYSHGKIIIPQPVIVRWFSRYRKSKIPKLKMRIHLLFI